MIMICIGIWVKTPVFYIVLQVVVKKLTDKTDTWLKCDFNALI